MAKANFNIVLDNDRYRVTATVTEGSFPRAVFVYYNQGTLTLGPYYTVADLQQFTAYPEWQGAVIDTFGAPFVRHTVGTALLKSRDEVDQWIVATTKDLKTLSSQLNNVQPENREISF